MTLENNKNTLLTQLFPFLRWIHKVPQVWRADLIAGITVALVLIPQSMAYAQLAGLPAYYGLYAAFMPPAIAALFGSSRQLATGPVAVVSLLTAATLEPLATAGGEAYIAYAILLTLIVGLFQLSLGLLKLGVLVNFLSHPVVLGFTNAAAIIIATSQLGKIFGVSVEKAEAHYQTVWNTLVAATTETHMMTLMFAIAAFAIMIILKKISPKIPGVLIAVAITTALSFFMKFENKQSVEIEQIQSASVQPRLVVIKEVNQKLTDLTAQLEASKSRFAGLKKQFGERDLRTLTEQQSLNILKLRTSQEQGIMKSLLKDMQRVPVYYIADDSGTGGTFVEEIPDGKTGDGNVWNVVGINSDGKVNVNAGGKVVGTVPAGLPSFKIPTLSLEVILQLIGSAIAIGLIGFMEAIAIAKAMATRTRQKLDTNQELVGQGMSNIVGSFFQSYPASGSFSRSAVNIGAGALSGFSSVVTTLVVVIALFFFTPLLYHLPQATLAAVIMMAVIGLVNFKEIVHIWKIQRNDGIVAIITFVLTLAYAPHLDRAIMIGVILSLVIFLYKTMKPRMIVLSRYRDGSLRDAELHKLDTCPNITMIRFDGSLYFANTSYFEDTVMRRSAEKENLKYIIVDGQGINQIDSTGEEMLTLLTKRLNKAGVIVLYANFKKQIMDVLRHSGFVERVGKEFFFRVPELALDHAWEQLGGEHDDVSCPLNIVCAVETNDPDPEIPRVQAS